jgi:lysophospholipase L1-like esterase
MLFQNRARFGSTVEKGSGQLEKDLRQGLACSFALVEFGGNDCSFAWNEVAAAPKGDHRPFTLPGQFAQVLLKMVDRLKGEGATPVLMTLPPLDAERHLKFIGRDEAARGNILEWLGDAQMIYRFHERYSKLIESIARQTQSVLVDVRSRFLVRRDLKQLIGPDGVHPSEAGYGMVARAFADFIEARRKNPGRLAFE